MLRCILGGWNFCKGLKAHFQLARLLLHLKASFPRWKTSHWSSFWEWPARQFPDTGTSSFMRSCLPLGISGPGNLCPWESGLLWGPRGHHHGTAPADSTGGCFAPGSAQLPAGAVWNEGGSGKSLHITHSTTGKTDGGVTTERAGGFQSPLCHLMENLRSTAHCSENPLMCCPWASLCTAVPPPRCQECRQILHPHTTWQMLQPWVLFFYGCISGFTIKRKKEYLAY